MNASQIEAAPPDRSARIFVSGHRGLVGAALVRRLRASGYSRILTARRDELDLRDGAAVDAWFHEHRPEYVLHAAGTVGGILANSTRPADFLYDNLMIHATVLRAAWRQQVTKVLYLGSSCIYPRHCAQPMTEDHLLSGHLEPTNAAYAIAKISGLMSCAAYRRQHGCNFISAMPTNLYGPYDNFDLESSHVIPALIRKFHDAKLSRTGVVSVWGSGKPRREFMHVDDLADACLFLLARYNAESTINVGTGEEVTIAELADAVRRVVYPEVRIKYDPSRPDGSMRKLLDISRLRRLGWKHSICLEAGIQTTYQWFLDHIEGADIRLTNPHLAA